MKATANDHTIIADLLPQYAAGTLEENRRRQVGIHLHHCPACREDLALWQLAAGEVVSLDRAAVPPSGLLEGALRRIRRVDPAGTPAPRFRPTWRWLVQLLRSQAPLVQREIWPVSLVVMLIGLIVAFIADQVIAFRIIAPLVAMACMSVLYGPENDPAFELAQSAPTSPWQILLARLVLVYGYNLVLALAGSLALLPLMSEPVYSELVLGWLAPMTFLSAAALALSLWLGSNNALTLTYLAWLAQLFLQGFSSDRVNPEPVAPVLTILADGYLHFWSNSGMLLLLSALLFALAFWLVGQQERQMRQAL